MKKKWAVLDREQISRGGLGSPGLLYCPGNPHPLRVFHLGPALEKNMKVGGMHIFSHPQNTFPLGLPQRLSKPIKQES